MPDRSELEPAFAARARQEAARYGPDAWVFVRELLQNARDAGARTIRISVDRAGPVESVVCDDDGEGMSFDHARRYLFSLYASSKEGRRNRAGRFGVGFWSVLRFEPARIEIASRPSRGDAWTVRLDGRLTTAELTPSAAQQRRGTVVRLERPVRDGQLQRRIADAVEQSARDLRQRDRSDRRIEVLVDGRSVNRPLSLPAPSVSFERRGQRGVVGLGPAPGVELFSQGLRVRSAPALPDLLGSAARSSELTRVRFPELADGIAPRALLEGGPLELSLARRDAHDSRSLRRLVRAAQRELGRLVERQLDHADPRPAWRRAASRLVSRPLPVLLATSVLSGSLLGLAWRYRNGPPRDPSPDATVAAAAGARVRVGPLDEGHRDLARTYGGPALSGPGSGGTQELLRYSPPDRELYLAALRVEALDATGRPLAPSDAVRAAPPLDCERDCVDVDLRVSDGPGPLRLPVPPRYGVVPGSVRLEGVRLPLQVDAMGQPLVALSAPTAGRLLYRVGPLGPDAWRPQPLSNERLPVALAAQAAVLRAMPLEARGPAALGWVSRRVRYSLSPEVAALHQERSRDDFLERSLSIGAGDCDVQSGVLLPLLQAAELPARLAVGYVGRNGRAPARLHAWVEYRTPLSSWSVADASAGVSPEEAGTTLAPATPQATRAAPGESFASAPWLVALAGLLGIGLLLALARSSRARLHLPEQADLPGLLRGALQRPDAFRDAPAVFHRRLLPLAAGGAISLADAWERAHEGRLFTTRQRSRLARSAARGGAAVLDARRPEAQAVGEMLGALPLDEWDRRLREGRASPVLAALEKALADCGEAWSLELAAVPSLRALELPAPGGVRRFALIPRDAAPLQAAEREWAARPRLATLELAEWVADALGVGRRARLLRRLAQQAVAEAARETAR